MEYLFEAWRTVAHISAWTGLSAAAIAGLAFLAISLPEFRGIAIRAAIVIGVAYGGLLYGDHVGRADTMAQWNAANAKAEQARQQRDAQVKADAEREMAPLVAQMRAALETRTKQVTKYEHDLLAAKSGAAACELGAGALRLRDKRAR